MNKRLTQPPCSLMKGVILSLAKKARLPATWDHKVEKLPNFWHSFSVCDCQLSASVENRETYLLCQLLHPGLSTMLTKPEKLYLNNLMLPTGETLALHKGGLKPFLKSCLCRTWLQKQRALQSWTKRQRL